MQGYDSREVMENGTQGERDSDRTEGDSSASRDETTKLSLEDDVDDDVFTEENHGKFKRTLVSSSGGSKRALEMRPQLGSFRQKKPNNRLTPWGWYHSLKNP